MTKLGLCLGAGQCSVHQIKQGISTFLTQGMVQVTVGADKVKQSRCYLQMEYASLPTLLILLPLIFYSCYKQKIFHDTLRNLKQHWFYGLSYTIILTPVPQKSLMGLKK